MGIIAGRGLKDANKVLHFIRDRDRWRVILKKYCTYRRHIAL